MDAPANEPLPTGPVPPRPEPPPERPRPSALGFFGVVLALFAALGTAAQAASPVLGLAWSEIFALLVPALIAASGSNVAPGRGLTLTRFPRPVVLVLAVAVGSVGFLAAGALMALNSLILPQRWVESFDVTRIFDRPLLERAGLAVVASTLAPFCEEVAFRGWLLTALRTRLPPALAIVAAGLLFAIMHLDPVRFGALLALGSVYGWLAWRAGSVWPSIVAHAANNTLGVVLAWSGAAGNATLAARARPAQIAASALLMLALAGGVLRLVAAGYARVTPDPPPIEAVLPTRDARDGSARFASVRVPGALLAAAVLGGVLLVLLLVTGHATRR